MSAWEVGALCAPRTVAGGFGNPSEGSRDMMSRRMSRTHAVLLVVSIALAAGCGHFDPAPPPPIRPTDKNVVLAWSIEEGLYDNGLARQSEVVQIRYMDAADDGMTEIQDYGRRYRGDERPRPPTVYRHHLTPAQLDEL